jgi:hypothetical protein
MEVSVSAVVASATPDSAARALARRNGRLLPMLFRLIILNIRIE